MDKERNLMFDVLKGLGIISVIFSHVYRGGGDPLAIFIRELAMWCVPMFFMVQGYFMYSPSYQNWFKSSWKKIKKSYIPYLIWALFYGGFYYYTIGKTFTWLDLILGKTALHLDRRGIPRLQRDPDALADFAGAQDRHQSAVPS